MDIKKIQKERNEATAAYDLALAIKALIEDHKKAYTGNWTDDEVEWKALELVGDE